MNMAARRGLLLKAIYDYESRSDSDISFSKGDRMVVLDIRNADWWRVLHKSSGVEGYVPANYVANESSLECEDWFFADTSRTEAEHYLMARDNPVGTFLVRSAGRTTHEYSLSVKDYEPDIGAHVKHYKIRPDGSGGFYIAPHHCFISLPTLITAYAETSNQLGLCQRLSFPCPKPTPQMYDLAPTVQDNWEIPRNQIQLIRKLGTGNFGEVYYGKWKENTEVAVKMLKEGTMTNQAFLEEATIMKKLRHKRLVSLFAVCTQEKPVYIVQEYMSRGSLLNFLRNGEGSQYKFDELIFIAAQVASGMEYLESQLLIHRDLAARNVLIAHDYSAKICDFGLARVIENDEYCVKRRTRFPVKWTAPEALVYGKFSVKSDVWSFGIFLMELFTKGQIPYPGMSTKEVAIRVQKGYRMPKPLNHELADETYELMLKCWDEEPDRRPTFEFLCHYFEGFKITSENMYKEPVTEKKEPKGRCCCC